MYEGKGSSPGLGSYKPSDSVTYHAYYQWVPFMLFIQGLMFYAPHFFWKNWEGGRLRSITIDLSTPIMNKNDRGEKIKQLAEYLQNSLWYNNSYATKFLLYVFSHFKATDQESRKNPMVEVFPRVTKCSMNMYGISGTIEQIDSLCVLAVNVINEKIYIAIIPTMRKKCLAHILGHKHNSNGIMQTFNQIGDIFLIYLLKKNIDCQSFDLLLTELSLGGRNNLKPSANEEDYIRITGV
nr:MAG: innexin [Penaeus monodon endogenous nimavirus]